MSTLQRQVKHPNGSRKEQAVSLEEVTALYLLCIVLAVFEWEMIPFFFFKKILAVPHGMWDLGPLTRDRILTSCSRNLESQPLAFTVLPSTYFIIVTTKWISIFFFLIWKVTLLKNIHGKWENSLGSRPGIHACPSPNILTCFYVCMLLRQTSH